MIVYFADRHLNILGNASTELRNGLTIKEDEKTEEIETGVAIFECKIGFDKATLDKVKACAKVGNYILRSHDNTNEFYTIIDTEFNTKKQTAYIYAEDAGLDLLNEIVGEYEADKAYPITHYIEKFSYDSGFVVGINEAVGLTRKLSWDGESTVTARLASVATQFDGCEISYSYDIKGLAITKKYINIYKQRGKDDGCTLRLNNEIDSIITTESISNLATALRCTGGTPEDAEDPITLRGYKYDDGDFYVDGDALKSRKAVAQWSRYIWEGEQNLKEGHEGHIVRLFSYDTTEQSTLCAHAITELKKAREVEVNYEVDIKRLPANVKIGDRVNIVDEAGNLYLSSRILKLESSAVDMTHTAVIGEHLIKSGGITQKVIDLAAQFATMAKSAAKALMIANNAKEQATSALAQANTALTDASNAQKAANDAQASANTAQEAAALAQQAADNAQSAVETVEKNVESLETTITNAQTAADNAQNAANIADAKAVEAAQAAAKALADAADANAAVEVAQSAAETAIQKADTAQETADTAKNEATTAQATANAAKFDAEQAKKDIASLGEELETVSTTMTADYARKTDLTEAEASLQSQISQNAAQISSTVSKIETIDETVNNAQEQAQAAQATANTAKAQADQAIADAEAAQTAADNAATASANAQSEANKAKAAAATAKEVADKAEANLATAKADLATVSSRVDATEEEIIAAQRAVDTAQEAADIAQANADQAAQKATEAQTVANTAVTNAAKAQTAADNAASAAALAQQTANDAKGDAAAAQQKADEAATTAANAKETADTAKANALNAQNAANQAATNAANAQKAADDADARAAKAEADLATAQQNLATVTSRVDATEAEVEAAQAAVVQAQAAADKANEDAIAAQSTADAAKQDAANAQTVADNAKKAADDAQEAANEAQKAADDAQDAVDALAVRVSTAETQITQNSEQIALRATKKEVTETLGGYSTKEETAGAISVKANEINQTVSSTYATKQEVKDIEVGGRNLVRDSVFPKDTDFWRLANGACTYTFHNGYLEIYRTTKTGSRAFTSQRSTENPLLKPAELTGGTFTLSAEIKLRDGNAITNGSSLSYRCHTTDLPSPAYQELGFSFGVATTEWKRVSSTFTFGNYNFDGECQVILAIADVENEGICIRNIKLEKGNKATDWTPAPEDVAGDIAEAQNSVSNAISEQYTSIISTCEDITLKAVEECVTEEEMKTHTEAQLKAYDDVIRVDLKKTTDTANAAEDGLNSFKESFSKHITFNSETAITIGSSGSGITLEIDNEKGIIFKKGDKPFGWWDGTDFHTGNIVVEVQQRAQLGNFAFTPLEDGSLTFSKVGG